MLCGRAFDTALQDACAIRKVQIEALEGGEAASETALTAVRVAAASPGLCSRLGKALATSKGADNGTGSALRSVAEDTRWRAGGARAV